MSLKEDPTQAVQISYSKNDSNRSESIKNIALALNKAQAVLEGAKKDSANPYFKSRYADLQSVWDAARKPMTDNGLSILQIPGMDQQGHYLETYLLHISGEWIMGRMYTCPIKTDPQGIGSAISYGRRYSLQAFLGICPEDDDGEGAMGRQGHASDNQTPPKSAQAPKTTTPNTKAAPKTVAAKQEPKKGDKGEPKPMTLLEQIQAACIANQLPEAFLVEKLKEHGYIAADEGLSDIVEEVMQKVLDHFQWFVDQKGKA